MNGKVQGMRRTGKGKVQSGAAKAEAFTFPPLSPRKQLEYLSGASQTVRDVVGALAVAEQGLSGASSCLGGGRRQNAIESRVKREQRALLATIERLEKIGAEITQVLTAARKAARRAA
jgi:hypothetical protein